MTVDEIMGLLAAYGEDRFYQRFVDGGPRFMELRGAIRQLMEERDEALARLEAMTAERDELQTEREGRDAECHGIEASERFALKADIRRAVDERDQAQEDYERLTRMRARSTRDRYDF